MAENAVQQRETPRGLVSQRPLYDDGLVRWYAARAGEGREDALARKLRSVLPAEVLEDAFCPRWEMVLKRRGEWFRVVRTMFPGYVMLVSADGGALLRALSGLSFAVPMAGRRGNALSPVDAEVQRWLEGALDEGHVLRASEGVIRAGELTVNSGPLKGSERRVRKIDRHRSMAWVGLGEPAGGGQTLLRVALSVPRKE